MSFLSLASEILLTPSGRSLIGSFLGECTIAARGMSYGYEVGQALTAAGIPWCAGVHYGDGDTEVNVPKRYKEQAMKALRERGWKVW